MWFARLLASIDSDIKDFFDDVTVGKGVVLNADTSASLNNASRLEDPDTANRLEDPDSASRSRPEPNVELVWSVRCRNLVITGCNGPHTRA